MSADSRDFGFVPQNNIRGIPSLIFWASGSRYGQPNQLHYTVLTNSRLTIWAIALTLFAGWSLYTRRRNKELLSTKENP
jgi:hypothetical protein